MTKGTQILAVVALAFALTGCPGSSAQELLDTAQLEEMQENLDNASKIYRQVIEKYPGSPEAEKARARLDAMKK